MMMGRIFLLLGLAALSSGALLGSKECTYGPSYWCSSLRNSKECGATKHCIQAVWEKQVLPEDTDDVCAVCKEMVKEARDQLQSNETQEDLKAVFEGSCNLLPVKVIRQECIKIVDEFIPELIDTLASQMNPQVVCATAGLCNSPSMDRLIFLHKDEFAKGIEGRKTSNPDPIACTDCKAFVKDTIRIVSTHPKIELLHHLMAICGRLSSLSDGCMALVESNFNDIYSFLTNQLNADDFCDLVGVCERMFTKTTVTSISVKEEPCDFCVAIVDHWRTVLISNTTEEEFRTILLGICGHTGKFKLECKALVDTYFVPLYKFLTDEFKPKEICSAVGLCGENSLLNNEEVPIWSILSPADFLPMVPLQPAQKVEPKKEKASPPQLPRVKLAHDVSVVSLGEKGQLASSPAMKRVDNPNACIMCEFILHFLQNYLQDNQTRFEIKSALDKVCQLMPKSVVEQCEDYVEAYGDQIIQLLILEIDPAKVCSMIHLCPGSHRVHAQSDQSYANNEVKSDVSCVMCEFAVAKLEELLKDNKTEESIKHNLETLCSVIPKTVRKECEDFVDLYTDQLINLLIHEFTPDQICVQLGLCKDKTPSKFPASASDAQLPISRLFVPLPVVPSPPKKSGFQSIQSTVCVLCEFVMFKIDDLLLNNATIADVEQAAKHVCFMMPSTIQSDCLGFVEEYGPGFIEMLVDKLEPKAVCRELSLCKDQLAKSFRTATVKLDVNTCEICEDALTWVDDKLKNADTKTRIDTVLESVCFLFPSVAFDQCRNMIEVYGPYFMNLLAELKPKEACQAIGICPKQSPSVQLLGKEKCTWGPSYWCQTQLHARACKATKHCEDKIWTSSKPRI